MKLLSCVRLFVTPWTVALPGSSIHGIFQARVLEWVAISFSRRSSRSRDWTRVSCIVGRRFTIWATGRSFYWKATIMDILQKVYSVFAVLISESTLWKGVWSFKALHPCAKLLTLPTLLQNGPWDISMEPPKLKAQLKYHPLVWNIWVIHWLYVKVDFLIHVFLSFWGSERFSNLPKIPARNWQSHPLIPFMSRQSSAQNMLKNVY